jgi:hypothetical protein
MKISLLLFLVLSSFAHASEYVALKEYILTVSADLPEVYGADVSGKIMVEHDENFARVSQSEVRQKIANFIYFEKGREIDSFDPDLGEGVLIAKENLKGIIDTDLLKAKFEKPYYQLESNKDVYPIIFKFRASVLNRIFKKIKILVSRKPLSNELWKTYYKEKEVDGLDIKINAFGRVLRLNLLLKGKIVESLNLDQIENVRESDF